MKRTRCRKALRFWEADYARQLAEEAGLVEPEFWPERGHIVGDEPRQHHGGGMIWSLRGAWQKAMTGVDDGSRVTITATVRRWDNGIGGYCTRIRLVSAEKPATA